MRYTTVVHIFFRTFLVELNRLVLQGRRGALVAARATRVVAHRIIVITLFILRSSKGFLDSSRMDFYHLGGSGWLADPRMPVLL